MEFQQISPTLFSENVDKQNNNNSSSNFTHSVEPSPRFGDDNDTRNIMEGLKQQMQNNNSNAQYNSSINHHYMKQIDLINQNQFQEFVRNCIFNENEQSNTVNSSNLKNSIQIENLQSNIDNQQQNYNINSKNHQHQQSVQDDLHDFSFSQQLDNSNSCIMDDQLSLNQNITITNNNNNMLDSIQKYTRKRQKNSQIYQDDYVIDSDMESILMQSPPSNNQDILKKFCHSLDKNNNNSLNVFRQSSQSIQSMKSNSKQNTQMKRVSLTQNKQSNQNIKNIRDVSNNNSKLQKNANLPLQQQSTNKQQQPILQQQQQQIISQQYQNTSQNDQLNTSNIQLQFSQSLSYIEQKWSDFQKWPESSPLRIELFALEMQSVYGSYYRNKVKVDELINNLVKEQSNRLAYIEAWKHKFRKTQKETMQAYVQLVEKNKEFLDNLFTNNNNNQNNNKHQQSIEDISPRAPPVMTQNSTQHNYTNNNNNINNMSSSKSNLQRRKRQDRCKSKTPPGALQDFQNSKLNQQIPKLEISRTSNNDNSIIGTIESCRDEIHTTNKNEYLQYSKVNNSQTKQKDSINSVNHIVSNSTQLSPINRMSLGYKNPFKKLVQQKQKIRALQSPQLNNNSPRHNFTGSHYMTVDISNKLEDNKNLINQKNFNQPIQPYSPKSSQQQNIMINNNSNESSPDMPSQLDTDKLSVYSQNQLIQNNNTVTNQQKTIKSSNMNNRPVINMSIDLKNIGKDKQKDIEQNTNDVIIDSSIQIMNKQEKDDILYQQVSKFNEEEQLNNVDTEMFQSARNQQQLQEEVQQIYQELLEIQDDEQLIKQNVDVSIVKSDTEIDKTMTIEQLQMSPNNQISPDNQKSSLIDETLQNIIVSQNIHSQQQSPNQLEIQQPNQEDLDSFIQSQILYSDRSNKQKSVKSVRFSDENFDNEIRYEQTLSSANKNQNKTLYSSTQNTLTLESSNNQVENIKQQQQQEPLRIIVKKQNKQQHIVSSAVYLYNENSKQKQESHNQSNKLENILHIDDNNTNSAKHTMDEDNLNGFQTIDMSQNNDQQNTQQQYHYNTQETEIYHNQIQDSNTNDQQQWSHFKPKYNNNLSLTPQNKKHKSQFSFIKTKRDNIDYNENEHYNKDDLIQNFEVFSQQEIIQPSSSFSPCYSRVSKLKQRRNYCFKNYVTIDSRFDKPIAQLDRFGREIKVNNTKKGNNELEEHFEQIEISDNLPQQLVNVINTYNQQDSLFNTCLLTKQTVNDIIKFQDESNPQTLYTISELRLDSQQQQYFKEIFTQIGGTDKDYKKYSLIKAHAQFQIPQANRLYQDLQNPLNRIYNSTGQVTIQNQNPDNNLYQINKVLNKYDGLMRSRQSNMTYYTYQLKEEDGLIIIIQTHNQNVSLFKKFSLFTKDYDNFLQIIKLRTIQQGNRSGEKDLIDIKLFYCVDYKLLIDDELKQNNLNIGLQEVIGLIDAIKVYDREL